MTRMTDCSSQLQSLSHAAHTSCDKMEEKYEHDLAVPILENKAFFHLHY